MEGTPVRALNSIKSDGIGGVANNPVKTWIFRNDMVDSALGKRSTFLAKKLLNEEIYKEPCIISSYRIVVCNPDYTEVNDHEDQADDHGLGRD